MIVLEKKISDRLYDWDERIAKGDHSDDAWAISVLKSGSRWSENSPTIFYCPRSAAAIEIALKGGVDFTARRDNGETVLFETDLYDTEGYEKVARVLAAKGLIDAAEEEGLTALSCQVKFGCPREAEILLKLGASPNSFGRIARYGYSRLDIAAQAINVMFAGDRDRDQLSIQLLSLLKQYGLKVSPEEKKKFLLETSSRPPLNKWIIEYL